jgi:hypothetical protein
MADNKGTTQNALDTNAGASASAESTNLDLFLLNLNKKEKAQFAANERLTKAEKLLMESTYKSQMDHIKSLGYTEQKLAAELAKVKKKMNADVVELAQKMEENFYRYSSKQTKIQLREEEQATLKAGKLAMQQQLAEKMASNDHILSKTWAAKKYNANMLAANKKEIELERDKRKLTIASLNDRKKDGIITGKYLNEQLDLIKESHKEEVDKHQNNIQAINDQIAAQEKLLEEAEESGNGLARDMAAKEIDNLKQQKSDESAALKKADKERFGDELLANTLKAGFKGMEQGLSKLGDTSGKAMDNAINEVGQYKSVFDARLQGTQSSYDDVAATLKRTLAISPFVKQTEVLKKLNDAVDKGIAYNVEQRAFLATMTDKIVATFDAFDANLMRIIRLQQADTTAARMGMEANLLQFFNSTFSDNSYLTDGYDQVSQALVDANAQMTRDMSVAFEYNVQKWMGSLASLGFGTDTIQTIAQGINYLGSGNTQALAGNTQLQSLLAMSASRAGLSYSDLLVKGIDDSSVNILLKAMVEYLAEIAEDNNAVVKAAYGDVFNFTQSDLRAIKNLTTSDIANISNQTMTFSKSMAEIQSQLNQVGSRLSTNEMIDNVFDNFLYSAGESLASNPATAILWRTLTTLEEVTGGIDLPFINVMGFGLDLNMSVESLLKTGMFGLSALSQVGNMVTSIASGGGLDLGWWGGTEYTQRGGDFESTVGGVQSTKSGSRTMTSAASSDTKKAALASTEEDQEEQKKASKEAMKDEITIETLYKKMFEEKSPIYVLDTPLSNKVDAIVTAVSNVNTNITKLNNLMNDSGSNGIRAYVTNLNDTPTTSVPSSFSISSINSNIIRDLAEKIADGVLGKTEENQESDSVATLSDIANILINGVISVRDEVSSRTLAEINSNLY